MQVLNFILDQNSSSTSPLPSILGHFMMHMVRYVGQPKWVILPPSCSYFELIGQNLLMSPVEYITCLKAAHVSELELHNIQGLLAACLHC